MNLAQIQEKITPKHLENFSISQLAELRHHLEALHALERKDAVSSSYASYINEFSDEEPPAKHHDLLIDALQRVSNGEIKQLIVNMPPGSAKSFYSSINYPPFWIQQNPGKLLIGASHAGDLAERFGRKVRNIVGDAQYTDLFDVSLKSDSKAAGRWETDTDSEYYAVGTGGSITGRRGDIGLIDDPVKGREEADSDTQMEKLWEWYLSDFLTRLKPGAPQIIIQTRWSENDLAGRILPIDYDGGSGWYMGQDSTQWYVINLPMEARENDPMGRKVGELLWPEYFTAEWVKEMKGKQTARNWNCLYQGDPAPSDGTQFKRADFQWFKHKPKNRTTYITGDYAVTKDGGDFTEIGVWGVDPNDDSYLIDSFRGQINSLEITETLIDFIELYSPACAVGESGVIRRALEPIIKKRMTERKVYTRLEWLPTTGDKVAMARSFEALVQQGKVHFPNTDKGDALAGQLIAHPAGRWDDGVDMCGLFGRYINKVWKANKSPPKKGTYKVKTKGLKIADFMDDFDE